MKRGHIIQKEGAYNLEGGGTFCEEGGIQFRGRGYFL